MRLTNTFWPLARWYVVHCISEAPHKHDVVPWNCALGVKPAFSEILPFFKVLVCSNFMWKCIRVTKHRHIYLGAVLLALCVDWIGRFSHTGLENFGHIKYCSTVALENDHKKHFQGYIVLLFSSFLLVGIFFCVLQYSSEFREFSWWWSILKFCLGWFALCFWTKAVF